MSERSPTERAFDFVALHGDALAAAHARGLVEPGANQEVLPLLSAAQSALEGAHLAECERTLWACMDLRLLASPFARALGGVVARSQGGDGAFRAAGAGDDEALRCTGMLAGCLARSPFARPETLEAAGDFLAAHWDPDRVSNGRLPDLAAHALFFANALHERADEVLQWCGRELERGFRMRAFDAVQTTRVLVDCDAHSLPGASFEPGELLVALLTEQAQDGSFGRAAEAGDRVESTLHGLHALRRFQPAGAR